MDSTERAILMHGRLKENSAITVSAPTPSCSVPYPTTPPLFGQERKMAHDGAAIRREASSARWTDGRQQQCKAILKLSCCFAFGRWEATAVHAGRSHWGQGPAGRSRSPNRRCWTEPQGPRAKPEPPSSDNLRDPPVHRQAKMAAERRADRDAAK